MKRKKKVTITAADAALLVIILQAAVDHKVFKSIDKPGAFFNLEGCSAAMLNNLKIDLGGYNE